MPQTKERSLPSGGIALNTDTSLLKLIAIVLMVIDHTGLVLDQIFHAAAGPAMPEYMPQLITAMRTVGRMAFPIFAWCIAVGSEYTRNPVNYMKRLALFYFISQPIYVLAFNRTWTQNNIYITLFFGLLCIWALRERQYWAVPLIVLVANRAALNYGIDGLYIIVLMYLVRRSKLLAALLLGAFCVYWGHGTTVIFNWGAAVESYGPGFLRSEPVISFLSRYDFRMQSAAILALPLIIIPTHSHIKLNKYVFYLFYPAHLLIFYIIKQIVFALK